jgi:hypothetical protein
MSSNIVSGSLSDKDKKEIMDAIKTIKDKLPFLIDLSNEERRNLLKLGDKSRAFVDKAVEVGSQNVNLLPRSFDLEEFQRDVQLFSDLNRIRIAFSQLGELIDDTLIAVGSDAYSAALEVYTYMKVADTGAGLDELKAMMSKRFAKNRKASANTNEAEA